MARLKEIAIGLATKIALWGLMVASYYTIKSIGLWVSLAGAILLGVVEGAFPRLRRWFYK